jgi:hypothetical protein
MGGPDGEKDMDMDILTKAEQQMIDLWNDGYTGTQIGKEFGVSRAAILGRLHRLKLKGYVIANKAEKSAVPKNEEIAETLNVKLPDRDVASELSKRYTPTQLELAFDVIMKVEELRTKAKKVKIEVQITGLTHFSCRYVIENSVPAEAWFCGKPKTRGAYCEDHANLCYIPLEDQKNKQAKDFVFGRMQGHK